MKYYHIILLSGILLLFGYGTATSITEKDSYINYATVHINDSIQVQGQLINLSHSTITISIDGAHAEYSVQNIISYSCYTAPNPELMQRDIVANTARSTSHSGFFVAIAIISLAVTAILVTGQLL